MFVYTYKKYHIRVYFNQLNSSLCFNGKQINSNSIKNIIYVKFLNMLNISINIIPLKEKHTKRIHISDKLILNILKHISKKIKNNEIISDIKIINNKNNLTKNKKIYTKNYFWVLSFVLILLTIVFFFDYKSIEAKINQTNYLEIKKLESDYNINKCDTNGNLSLLKQKCELMLNKIEILRKRTPTTVSVFIIWIMDILNSYFITFNFINCIITIFIIIIIYLIIK